MRKLASVDHEAALAAAEGHVYDGALVGHERRECHHLLFVDAHGVADAALDGQLVVTVLGAVGLDDLDAAVVALDGELRVVGAVAHPDLIQQALRVARVRRRLVEHVLDLFEKGFLRDFFRSARFARGAVVPRFVRFGVDNLHGKKALPL